MKSLRIVFLLLAFAGLIALAYWMAHQPRLRLQTDEQIRRAQETLAAQPVCPLTLVANGTRIDPAPGPDMEGLTPPQMRWSLVRSNGDGAAPEVTVRTVNVAAPDGRQVPACILEVTAIPKPPFREMDWRIGYRLDLSRLPAEPGGKAVFRALVQPDRPVTLGGGNAYLYDGTAVVGQSLENPSASWLPIEVTADLAPDTGFIELWYRLAYQGAISEPATITIADPRLEFQPGN